MTNFGAFLSQVTDIVTAVEKDEVHLVTLAPNTKECRVKGWNKKIFTKEELFGHTGNFGIRICKFSDGTSLICIDTDGTEPNKVGSKKLIGDNLVKALAKWGMIVETASDNGIHIYLRVMGKPTDDAHSFSKQFCYPDDLDYAGMPKLAGKPLGNAIEIFTPNQGSRYLVAPGSQINDKIYRVSEKSHFKEILSLPKVEYSKVEHLMEEALLKAGFTHSKNTQQEIEKKYDVGYVRRNDKLESLSQFIIPKFGDFLIPIYKYNDGSKYYMTLALSGYLSNFVDEESVIRLGEYIVDNTEADFFKDDQHFLDILTSSYHNNKEHQTGGRTLYDEYAKEVYSGKEFWFKMVYFTNNNVFFYPAGKKGTSYKKILLNSYEHQVELEHYGVNKKGEEYLKSAEPVLGFQILDVKRISNPVIEDAPEKYELSYISSGQSKIKTIVGETMKDIEDELKQQVGLVLNGQYKAIFNQLIVHFSKINFINTDISSSVPGIFDIDGKIRRFNYNKEEILPKYNKDDLRNAVNLLNDIKDVFPTDSNKLGHLIRIGMLLPFYHILKNNGHIAKYLILGEAGGALKSTISEMLVNFYNPTKKTTKQANIFNGGAFSSPFQVGEKFGISSYPFVVNEPGTALRDDEIIEILKSAIESDVARVTHDGSYYSYSTAILSTNVDIAQTDAFLRRSNIFYFKPAERATKEDIENIAQLLNKNTINDRFKELSPIGDFCFTYLAENNHLFKEMTIEELELHLVDKIEQVVGLDLDWMKQNAIEDSVEAIEEVDTEILNNFLQEVKDSYNRVFSTFQRFGLKEDKTDEVTPIYFRKDELITLIVRGGCSLLDYSSKDDKILITSNNIKTFFKKSYDKLVTATTFYEELNIFQDQYHIEQGRFYVKRKQVRGIKVEPELIVDLLNDDLRDDDNESQDTE